MRHLSRFCAALALACAFTLPAVAGEIHAGIAPPPPPPPPSSSVEGEISAGLTELILSVVETVISLR
jgi:hypothetical protein